MELLAALRFGGHGGPGGTPLSPVACLIIGSCITAFGVWWMYRVFFSREDSRPVRWGRLRSGPPASVFSAFASALAILCFGACMVLSGYFGWIGDGLTMGILVGAFCLVLVSLVADTIAEIGRRKKNPELLQPLRQHARPFRKRAHAYTLSAVVFGLLAYVLIRTIMDGWRRFPPEFFSENVNSRMNAWIPTVIIAVEILLVVQAVRYWITEKATQPSADYLNFEHDHELDEDDEFNS